MVPVAQDSEDGLALGVASGEPGPHQLELLGRVVPADVHLMRSCGRRSGGKDDREGGPSGYVQNVITVLWNRPTLSGETDFGAPG